MRKKPILWLVSILIFSLILLSCSSPLASQKPGKSADLSSSDPSDPSSASMDSQDTVNSPTETYPEATETITIDQLWVVNNAGQQEIGGVTIEISRVIVGYKHLIEYDWDYMAENHIEAFGATDVVCGITFKVTNNADIPALVLTNQGHVQIGEDLIKLTSYSYHISFGEHLGGRIDPGTSKKGSIWFPVMESSPEEINQMMYFLIPPSDLEWDSLGPDYEIPIDVSQKSELETPFILKESSGS